MAAILGTLLSGCVALPIPISGSKPLPDIAPYLPEDLRSSNDEVLVMVQSRESSGHSWGDMSTSAKFDSEDIVTSIVTPPIFMRGRDLPSLQQVLKSESMRGIFILPTIFPLVMLGIPPVGMGVRGTGDTLQRLCIITPDGRNITVFPNDNEKPAPYQLTIFKNRRDAMVAALREDTKTPFEQVKGPCGISGKADWPRETRTRTIDFLARIPGKQPADANKPLAEILSRAKTATDAASLGVGSGMLLVSTRLHEKISVAAPMFFSPVDFKAFRDIAVTSDATQIIPLLPPYASGTDSLEYLNLDLLVAVGSDGRVLWWSQEENAWKGVNENPPAEEWKADTWGALNSLPEADRNQATAFLERAHVKDRVRTLHAAMAELKTSAETSDASAANVMLLGFTFSKQGAVMIPLFLQTGNIPSVVTAIRSLTAGDLMGSLPRVNPTVALPADDLDESYVCLISDDGRIIALKHGRASVWDEPSYSRASVSWYSEASNSVREDGRDYQGWHEESVCSLVGRTTGWPTELRGKVRSFLKKIVTENDAPVKR